MAKQAVAAVTSTAGSNSFSEKEDNPMHLAQRVTDLITQQLNIFLNTNPSEDSISGDSGGSTPPPSPKTGALSTSASTSNSPSSNNVNQNQHTEELQSRLGRSRSTTAVSVKRPAKKATSLANITAGLHPLPEVPNVPKLSTTSPPSPVPQSLSPRSSGTSTTDVKENEKEKESPKKSQKPSKSVKDARTKRPGFFSKTPAQASATPPLSIPSNSTSTDSPMGSPVGSPSAPLTVSSSATDSGLLTDGSYSNISPRSANKKKEKEREKERDKEKTKDSEKKEKEKLKPVNEAELSKSTGLKDSKEKSVPTSESPQNQPQPQPQNQSQILDQNQPKSPPRTYKSNSKNRVKRTKSAGTVLIKRNVVQNKSSVAPQTASAVPTPNIPSSSIPSAQKVNSLAPGSNQRGVTPPISDPLLWSHPDKSGYLQKQGTKQITIC